MMVRILFVILFATCAFLDVSQALAQDKVFNAKSFELKNGLQIVVVENNRAPVVTHMIWYKVGAADEPRGKSGIAHFYEHLMFKGHSHPELGTFGPGEFSRIVRSLGGEDNAFTSQDYTAYFQSIASEHLEKMMRMEAGRMRGLNIPQEEFDSENKVILEERAQRTDTDPRAQMAEQMNEALYPNHPYAIPIIGWAHEIEALTLEDAISFYDQYYVPNNAVVVVSGHVKAEEVFEMAKRTYGLLERGEDPVRVRTVSPPFISDTTVTLLHETIQQPVLKRVFRVPSYRQKRAGSLALEVLDSIMGGGASSRLYKSLVVEQKLATGISFSYHSASWDDASLSISATPAEGVTLTALELAIDEQIRNLIVNGVSEEELKEAKLKLQAEAIYARDSLSGPAMIIGYSIVTGSTLDDIESWPLQIEGVTAEQVQAVAAKYLNPDAPYKYPPVTGILLPKPKKGDQ